MGKQFQVNKDLFLTDSQHTALLSHCRARLVAAKSVHTAAANRFRAIDKEVAGYIRLDDEDKKRKDDTERGFGPKPYSINLQLTRTQLDEAVTYFMAVFYPEEGPYTATAPAAKQDIAKGLSVLMNQQASMFKHYRHMARSCFDAMKYNLGLLTLDWAEIRGIKQTSDTLGNYKETSNTVLAQGNKLVSLDPYNTLLDPSVNPVDLATDGEFFATIDVITRFRARRNQAVGNLYNLAEVFASHNSAQPASRFYTLKPDITGDAIKGDGYNTNWVSYLSAGEAEDSVFAKDSVELSTLRIWLPAKALGLDSKSTGFQIWKIVIANGSVVVLAEQMLNAHGILPLFALMPWDDHFDRQTQSFAEVLLPYQRFASFQMNIHQHAQRKALYGLLFYDDRIFPSVNQSDMVSGKFPMQGGLGKTSVNELVKQINDAPDTQNTLRDVDTMGSLMQKLLPTDQANQVASLERATMYQTAATVQASNRRNLKIAKLIDTQAFEPLRRACLYNIKQYQTEITIFDPSGTAIEIQPKALRDTDFEFAIGAGLRGIDKLIIVEMLQKILFAILQSPQASQSIDTVALMDYITSVMGDYTDLNQFKFKSEFDKLSPQEKQTAFQLLQHAMQTQAAAKGQAQGQTTAQQGAVPQAQQPQQPQQASATPATPGQ